MFFIFLKKRILMGTLFLAGFQIIIERCLWSLYEGVFRDVWLRKTHHEWGLKHFLGFHPKLSRKKKVTKDCPSALPLLWMQWPSTSCTFLLRKDHTLTLWARINPFSFRLPLLRCSVTMMRKITNRENWCAKSEVFNYDRSDHVVLRLLERVCMKIVGTFRAAG